jgi:aconitate hydratase
MPAGAKVLPYRSNIPRISQYCFAEVDPDFSQRAKATGNGIIVAGSNYGQGSSREHAALVPMYLGIRCVIAKSFARIHQANLINFGILPLVFANPEDYETVEQSNRLRLSDIKNGIANGVLTVEDETTKRTFSVLCSLSERQQKILLAGGVLNYTRGEVL